MVISKNPLLASVRFQSAEPKLEPKSKEQSCKTKVVLEVEREREREAEREREREQRGRGAEGDKEEGNQNKRKTVPASVCFQSVGQKLEPKRKEQSC